MAGGVRVQKLVQDEAVWRDLGVVSGLEPKDAVGEVARRRPGIYRVRETYDEPWHFFYVDESGIVIDSNAFSRL